MAQKSLVKIKSEEQATQATPEQTQTALALPSGVSDFLTAPQEDLLGGQASSPWASFAHKMSPNWDKDAPHIPGMVEGDFILHLPGGNPIKVNPVKFFFLRGYQYWAYGDGTNVEKVSFEPQKRLAGSPPKNWGEMVEAAIIVYHERRCYPCTVRAANTKCPAFVDAQKAVKEAATPEWVNKSEANRLAAKVPLPSCRVITEIKLNKGVAKSTGRAYLRASGIVTPSTEEHWSAFLRMGQTDEEAKKWLNDVIEAINKRSLEIKALSV